MNDVIVPNNEEFQALQIIAKKAAESKYFTQLGGEGGLLSIVLYARELGLPPMQCLFGGMRNIQGNIEVTPRLMNSMIRKAGHQINIIRSDDEICTLKGIRKDTGESYECSYSMTDAQKAGNAKKQNYIAYASDMLFARCLSRLARRLFSDVISTAYVEGEINVERPKEPQRQEIQEADAVVVEEPVRAITEGQWAELDVLLAEFPDAEQKIKDRFRIETVYEMPAPEYPKIVEWLKGRKEASKKEDNV